MIVSLNGTHGAGKTTTSALLQPLLADALHADQAKLRERIQNDEDMGPSESRFAYLDDYARAADVWLHDAAEVIDTAHLTPAQAARQIADSVLGR